MPIRDIGKFVARYFQVIAALSIASMIITAIIYDSLIFDFSWILLLWAAHHLLRHNHTARKWTVRVLTFNFTVLLAIYAAVLAVGTDGMKLEIGSYVKNNPALWEVSLFCLVILILIGAPLALLLTPKAKREFGLNK